MRTCLDISIPKTNDKIQVTYTRNGKNNVVPVVLSKNEFSSTEFKGIN
jgi:hypothetical protein